MGLEQTGRVVLVHAVARFVYGVYPPPMILDTKEQARHRHNVSHTNALPRGNNVSTATVYHKLEVGF